MKIKEIGFVGIPVTDMNARANFMKDARIKRPDPEMTGKCGRNIRLARERSRSHASATNGDLPIRERARRLKWKTSRTRSSDLKNEGSVS